MKIIALLVAVACVTRSSLGQGTVTVTFDGPPVVAPEIAVVATNYYEAGMWFRPIPGSRSFIRRGPTSDPLWPKSDTTFVQAALGDSLMFSFTNGSTFNLISVDLAGYSSVVPDVTAQFVGYRADGSVVTTNVDTHDITFQTFFFNEAFSNLTRVEIPDFGSLDNLVVEQLPIAPPPPALAIETVSSPSGQRPPKLQVCLLWPTNAGNHQLLTSTNLALTNWSAVSPPPVIVGTNNVVTNDIVGPRRFYRLSTP
jgi:hypothetical protein